MPIATIVGALIAAASTLTAGALNAKSQKEANKLNLAYTEKQSQEEAPLRQLAVDQAKQELSLSRQSMAFQKKEAALNRQAQEEQTQYNRLQHAADKFAEYRNSQSALQQNRLSPLMRG